VRFSCAAGGYEINLRATNLAIYLSAAIILMDVEDAILADFVDYDKILELSL
jgi:hypothetical protein